jgi:hypothetical protein
MKYVAKLYKSTELTLESKVNFGKAKKNFIGTHESLGFKLKTSF